MNQEIKLARSVIQNASAVMSVDEMSNIRQKRTGLPMVIWLKAKDGKEKHGPRIKVQNSHSQSMNSNDTVSVTIADEPQIIPDNGLSRSDAKLIIDFVKRHKENLLKHWRGEMSTLEITDTFLKKPE